MIYSPLAGPTDDSNLHNDDDSASTGREKGEELRVELSTKQKEVDQLVADVRRLQSALTKLKEAQVDAASDLTDKLATAEKEAAEAKHKLEAMKDYDEVKKELR